MKTKLGVLLLLVTTFARAATPGWMQLTNVQIPTLGIGASITKAIGQLETNDIILSNNATAGGGGPGYYITMTNGNGTNLTIAHPFTLVESAEAWVQWDNPPAITTPPTNLPPNGDFTNNPTGCTNMAGPYRPTSTPGVFTNACGYVMIITTGGDPTTDPGAYETNFIPTMGGQVDAFSKDLYQITVTDSAFGLAGTYKWTNGLFYLNGLPTNCDTRTLAFDCGGNKWIFHKKDGGNGGTQTSINGGIGGKLNTSLNWGGNVAVSATAYNTNVGFPRYYWPGFDMQVSGLNSGDTNNFNGYYRFHHRVNSAFGYTNDSGLYMIIGGENQIFNNSWVRWTNLSGCTLYSDSYWHNKYDIMELALQDLGQTVNPTYALRKNKLDGGSSPISTVKIWTLTTTGGHTVTGSPTATPINRPNQWTNQIVICPPPPPGEGPSGGISGSQPPRLTYHEGQPDCAYLRTFAYYCALADALNHVFCQMDGTGCCNMWLANDGTFYFTGPGISLSVPQSDPNWLPCP